MGVNAVDQLNDYKNVLELEFYGYIKIPRI